MIDIVHSVLLGLVQGLTEFIPVSSSGHLILARELFGFLPQESDLAFDAVLQLATALAIGWFFRKDIFALCSAFVKKITGKGVEEKEQTLFLALVFGTIPAVIAGIFLETYMETTFRSGALVACMLVAGALLMFIADRVGKQEGELSVKKGFLVGLFQMLALVPGISRSGATISGGLFSGLNRQAATRFSFLLGFPILLGSGVKKLFDLWSGGLLSTIGPELLIGSVVAFFSGLVAIHFLLKYLKRHDLSVFVWYRLILAVIVLFALS